MPLFSQQMMLVKRHQRYWHAGLVVFVVVMIVISLCVGDRWFTQSAWSSADGKLFVWQLRWYGRWRSCWWGVTGDCWDCYAGIV